MKTKIIEVLKIDPKEFGLDETQVQSIESAFMPKIVERDGLKQFYKQVLTKEITPETCQEAKTIRLKLVKVRTGIAEIHKTQKAFYLAAGRYVDAWKNKETLPVTQMEENLQAIEEYYERIELEKISKLQEERSIEIAKYQDENAFITNNLGELTDEVWNNYLLGTKTAYETRKAAEKKAKEDEEKRIAEEKEEQERIKKENEKLKKEAEKLEAKAEAERKAKEIEEAKIQAELNKVDADKINDLINALNELKIKFEFKSKKNKQIYVNVGGLIDKVINYIKTGGLK